MPTTATIETGRGGPSSGVEPREVLEAYVDDYRERMERLSCDELARRQGGRTVSLAFGAAGIAYAHWHVATVLGDERFLAGAERWMGEAWRRRADASAYFPAGDAVRLAGEGDAPPAAVDGRRLADGAHLLGEIGVRWTRVLIAAATGRGVDPAIGAFVDLARRCPDEPLELYAGLAGALRATTLLVQTTGDGRLLALGGELAVRLGRRAAPIADRPLPWREAPGPGLAHGTAGVFFALLAWHRAAGAAVPAPLLAAVDRLLDRALADPDGFCSRPAFVASLCNGFAGLALLAVEAHAALGAPRFLAAARAAAARALVAVPPRPDLCCGRAGVAAACLALAGADPAGPWRRRAEELVLSALLAAPGDWETAGLYGGEAALPCLAADLLAGAPGGPPALSWPLAAGAPAPEAA
jgi:hypothetical protein